MTLHARTRSPLVLALRVAVVAAVAALAASARPARADALPPDEDCPSGQVYVRGHSGGCRPEAPSDCAPGWRGAIGGVCMVATVDEGVACASGTEPHDATLCLQKMLDRGNGRVVYDPPHEFDLAVGIVGPGAECKGDKRRAVPGRICLAPGATAAAFVPSGEQLDGPRLPPSPRRGCALGDDGAPWLAGALVALASRRRRARR
ncbi:MAG: hypothetical protein U1F43_16455 [Myxococcota bacterium]